MPRFAANLSLLFTELDFSARFAAAARAGFAAVECQFPYAETPQRLRARLAQSGLEMVLHNLPAGDRARGELGIACHPGREAEFRAGLAPALEYARALGCRRLNCLAGIAPRGADPARLHATLAANLRHAARRLAEADITLLVEPINTRDVPGFFLSRSAQARALVEEVGADNLRLQYDVYHMQIMEGDALADLERHLDLVGHVQIADAPGRHEPGTGTIDFPRLLPALDALGYAGWVGCEYRPRAATAAGLGWLAAYRTGRG